MRLRMEEVSVPALCALLSAFSRAPCFDGELVESLANAACDRTLRGEASISHIASVLSSLANSNIVWVDAAKTEDLFSGCLSPALTAFAPSSFSVQQVAVIASAFAKAKIFDEPLFAHLSRAVQWRGRNKGEFSVQVVGVLLFAFSRIQVDDAKLLDFLAGVIVEMPAAEYTPQALSVVISVYAGAHRRRSLTSLRDANQDPSELPLATGILGHLAAIALQIPPKNYEARHVRAIVQAYYRAGVRGEGLFEGMSAAWEARWGSGFQSEKEMLAFLLSLDQEDGASEDEKKGGGDRPGVTQALARWFTGT